MAITNTTLALQLRAESIRHDQELAAGRFPSIEIRFLEAMDRIYGETVDWFSDRPLPSPREMCEARATALALAADILAWRILGWRR